MRLSEAVDELAYELQDLSDRLTFIAGKLARIEARVELLELSGGVPPDVSGRTGADEIAREAAEIEGSGGR